MNGYRLSSQADRDMEDIWEYIAVNNEPAADRLIDNLIRHFQRIANNPRVGQQRNDLRPNLRLFPVENYVILFYPADDGIEVAGIIHGARDIDGLFKQGER